MFRICLTLTTIVRRQRHHGVSKHLPMPYPALPRRARQAGVAPPVAPFLCTEMPLPTPAATDSAWMCERVMTATLAAAVLLLMAAATNTALAVATVLVAAVVSLSVAALLPVSTVLVAAVLLAVTAMVLLAVATIPLRAVVVIVSVAAITVLSALAAVAYMQWYCLCLYSFLVMHCAASSSLPSIPLGLLVVCQRHKGLHPSATLIRTLAKPSIKDTR